jgi:hypothetical protein
MQFVTVFEVGRSHIAWGFSALFAGASALYLLRHWEDFSSKKTHTWIVGIVCLWLSKLRQAQLQRR